MIKKIIYSLSILSCSLGFSANSDTKYEKAIFAGGCFGV